jgi:hypothetical protein
VVIIHNLFSQFSQYPNMKVKILKHPFILQAIVAIFGCFSAFLLLKVKKFNRTFCSQNGEIFHQKKHRLGCAFMQGLHTHFGPNSRR